MLQTDLFTHSHERVETDFHLQQNQHHFSEQLQKVFNLLMDGVTLTQKEAMNVYGINSLSTRISELKNNCFPVTKGWSENEGVKVRRYYYLPSQIEEYKNRL